MKVNEILKKAALEAEKKSILNIPDDDCIDWSPKKSYDFKIQGPKPRIQRRYSAFIAAAMVAAVSVAVLLPFSKNESSDALDGISSSYSDADNSISSETASEAMSEPHELAPSETESEEISEPHELAPSYPHCDIEAAQPEYIPDGYSINNLVSNSDGSVHIEYTNGEDVIVFQSGPSELLDISDFEEIVGDVYINSNQGFIGNNINGYINNGVAWSDGEFNYLITNSIGGVTLDELMKIAESVNSEKND